MQEFLVDWLECPACRSPLDWKIRKHNLGDIEQAIATCRNCGSRFCIEEGIGIFLTGWLERNDLWQQADSELKRYLDGHPTIKKELLQTPLSHLSPVDQFFRHMILEEEGQFEESRQAAEIAMQGLYRKEYRQAWNSQVEYVLQAANSQQGPVIDLASGKGYLVEKLSSQRNPVVATDFSPLILRKTKKRLEHFGLSRHLSFLAVDARCTPFKDGIVAMLTTNLGLPNIEQSDGLLAELHRICGGDFYAIHHFFPRDDSTHRQVFTKMGNEVVHYKQKLLREFKKNHWKVNLENRCFALAKPTPRGSLIAGAEIDRIPVEEVTLEWCTIHAS